MNVILSSGPCEAEPKFTVGPSFADSTSFRTCFRPSWSGGASWPPCRPRSPSCSCTRPCDYPWSSRPAKLLPGGSHVCRVVGLHRGFYVRLNLVVPIHHGLHVLLTVLDHVAHGHVFMRLLPIGGRLLREDCNSQHGNRARRERQVLKRLHGVLLLRVFLRCRSSFCNFFRNSGLTWPELQIERLQYSL